MTKVELQDLLRSKGSKVSGNKPDLQRVKQNVSNNAYYLVVSYYNQLLLLLFLSE